MFTEIKPTFSLTLNIIALGVTFPALVIQTATAVKSCELCCCCVTETDVPNHVFGIKLVPYFYMLMLYNMLAKQLHKYDEQQGKTSYRLV
jgi:hypothetical protein